MLKSMFAAFAIGFVCLIGCSSNAPEASGSGDTNPFEGKLAVFEDWSSADGATRLAIIEENMDEKKHIRWLENHFVGRPIEELKQTLGEPDHAQELTRKIAGGPSTYRYYFYYMGTTTKDTPDGEQDLLEWRLDTLNGTLCAQDLKLRLKRFSDD